MEGIANVGHFANMPGVPPAIVSFDEGSSWKDDDTLESLPSLRDDMGIVTNQAIHFLDSYVYRDPVIDLTEIYRQKGVQDVDVYFQERRHDEDAHTYFRYTFECPLSGTFYHSSLPLPLFTNEPPLDLLVQLSRKVLGRYEIFDEGVFFVSRKHAKRSAALSALEALTGGSTNGILYPSPKEASCRLSQLSPTSVMIKTKHFPSWVHELCRLGISSKTIKISYQEQFVEADWRCKPTMLCCVMSIEKPIELTAVGLPCQSKGAALDSALALLLEELERQLPGFSEDFGHSPSTDELKDVLSVDPVEGSYVYPLPGWASDPIPTPKQLSEDGRLCLYEIEFRSIKRGDVTVLGIVFPCDPGSQDHVFEAEFDSKGTSSKETISVRLQKLQALDLSHLPVHEIDARIRWMKHFNRIVTQPERGANSNDIESPEDSVVLTRAFLFVPIVQSRFASKASSFIDWTTLRLLWQNSESATEKATLARSILLRTRDIFVLTLAILCFFAPSIPITVYKHVIGKEFHPNTHVKSWEHALGYLLLSLMFYILLFHVRSKPSQPSPRQLQMLKHMNTFIPLLEREIETTHFASQLCCLASRIPAEKYTEKAPKSSYECSSSLSSAVKEATSTIPKLTYQRLEFLGDSVLGFFLGINLMGMNSSLVWDSDELGRLLSAAANTRVLQGAALRSGIPRLLLGHRQEVQSLSYTSTYSKTSSDDQCLVVRSLLSIDGQSTGKVHDRILSDVVESLLGVAYLDGKSSNHDPSGGRMVIALLEHYSLPLPNYNSESGLPFFQAVTPCLKNGYHFNFHKAWRRQLVQIGTTLYCEHDVINRLETGLLKLMGNLHGVSSFDGHRTLMEKQTCKILLLCSLFNDNLETVTDSGSFHRMDSSFTSVSSLESDVSFGVESMSTSENGLIRIALLRDTLFMVGHYSLQLAISDELFNRYPDASEGSLSLQRACATSDDVMAYIMVKSGFHQSLYNQETRAEKRFVSEMSAAESIGREVWKRRSGWILKGGEVEFTKRCATLSFSMPEGPPRYCGLAGGRLYGHKSKLPDSLTEDLVFSMKSIAGALVLSLGLEGMWQIIGPLFGELLLLSAEELRKEYRKVSSICK